MSPRQPRNFWRVLLLVSGIILIVAIFISDVAAQRYLVQTYTEIDGLPSSNVRDVIQDEFGRMWFATLSGIACYDGARWSYYGQDDGLGAASQGHLLTDSSGTIWAVSHSTPLHVSRFDGETWVPIPAGREFETVQVIAAAAILQTDTTFHLVVGIRSGNLAIWNGAEWSEARIASGQPRRFIRAIEAVNGRFLIAAADGIHVLDPNHPGSVQNKIASIPEGGVQGLSRDPATNHLWIVGPDWIGWIEDGNIILHAENQDFFIAGENDRFVVASDRWGGVFFGNLSGLFHFSPQTGFESIGLESGLISGGAASLCVDQEENLWVSNPRGVTKIVSRHIVSYDKRHGLWANEVTSVVERKNGEIVLGHDGGLTIWKDKLSHVIFSKRPLYAKVLDLDEDPSGTLWIAVEWRGLGSMSEAAELRWHGGKETFGGPVTSVLTDSRGRRWVSGGEQLFRADGGRYQRIEIPLDQSASRHCRKIFEGPSGAIYVATDVQGVFRIRDDGITQWKHPSIHAANNVFSVLERRDGTVWAGTVAGLFRAADGFLEEVAAPGPDIDRPVFFILEDHEKRTWFGTDNGVQRWNGTSFRNITALNGLIGTETNRDAGLLDSKNRIWIGTNQGVSVYRGDFEKSHAAPVVQFLNVSAGNETLALDRNLSLKHDQNTLVFSFRAISFVDESRVVFRSWLEGFDQNWQKPQPLPLREVRYTNLSPGQYRFHLQAIDARGTYGKEIVSPAITVKRPLWKTGWFRLILAAVVTGLVFLVHMYFSRRQLKSEMEAARTQRLESLGVLAGGIAHDFNNYMTIILGRLTLLELDHGDDPKVREAVEHSTVAISRARVLTQQLLTFSQGGEPVRKVASIADVIQDSVFLALSGGNVACTVNIPKDLRLVEIDEGQMSQVINNLLINARQSMPGGGTIQVNGKNLWTPPPFLHDRKWIEIQIKDEGPGIAKEYCERIFDPYFTTLEGRSGLGLAIAYSIVVKHKGMLTLDTEVGKGSTFHIYLPATDKNLDKQPSAEPQAPTGSGNVLVMDDNEGVRRTIQKMLDNNGYTTVGAVNGEQAVEFYRESIERETRFDAVILDLTVQGGRGGVDALRRLQKIDPDVTAIVVSGYSNEPILAKYSSYGFRACLSKPFTTDQLAQVLNEVLARQTL